MHLRHFAAFRTFAEFYADSGSSVIFMLKGSIAIDTFLNSDIR